MTNQTERTIALSVLLLLASMGPSFAHTGTDQALGFVSGFLHPLTGADHLVAMVAVGLWGAQLGAPAIWMLPIAFPLIMAIGGVIGISGMGLPFSETVIAISGIALGIVVALRLRPALSAAVLLVSIFAIFHGYAHGLELPEAADPVGYGVGFVTATGLLHLFGILIGTLIRWPIGERLVRACGVAIGCVGVFFLLSTFGAIG